MKIAFATHALGGYPRRKGGVPSQRARRNLFAWLKLRGFDGVEVGDWWFDFFTADTADVVALKEEMAEYGLELAGFNCLRKCVTHPAVAEQNMRDLRRAIEVAKVVRPHVVSISLSLAPEVSGTAAELISGVTVSAGSSKDATEEEFPAAAKFLAELAEEAVGAGVRVALELHHCSIADTSRSLLRILDLAGHSNLYANPDLVNLYRAYDVPEEPWYEALDKLADRVGFWHLKNTQRIHVPELKHSFAVQGALGEGDIDYRWALARMLAAGYDGWLSIEGAGAGDLLAFAERGKAYIDGILADMAQGAGPDVY